MVNMKQRVLYMYNLNEKKSDLKNRDDIISIVIPTLNRYLWIEKLINSLHEYADYPFEIIVNDDGSSDESGMLIHEKLFDKITFLIYNCRKGKNQGLPTVINRMVSCSTSKYIVMLNSDMEIKRPFFRDVINMLDKKYVGFTTLLNSHTTYDNIESFIENKGTKFTLQESFGQGCAIAYRREIFDEVGGLSDVNCLTSDGHFMFNIWKHGYFNGKLLFNESENPIMIDNSKIHTNNSDSTLGNRDGNFPNYFCINQKSLELSDSNRNHYINLNSNDFEYGSEYVDHFCNTPYWQNYMMRILNGKHLNKNNINWNMAKKHNQFQFKKLITEDIKHK